MTPLGTQIAAQIEAGGPITLAEYMSLCLMYPEHGYYATRDPFGAAGDFITAPEISQMFGELVGLSLAQAWLDQGAPERFALVELGPGRGTLMADVVRATRGVPGFAEAAQVHLIEASPALRMLQQSRVVKSTHHTGLVSVPDLPIFAIANEFFDALPIRQFERRGAGWCERRVGLTGGVLGFGLGAPGPVAALDHRLQDTRDGDVVELATIAADVAGPLGKRIAAHGGAALLIDYGDWRSLGDTFQALRGHEAVDPFAAPGQADLTTHVDFEALALAAAPARHTRLTPQGVFLERLGITARAEALAATLSGAALEAHIAAHRRLTHPSEMGTLFKVMGLYPEGTTPPPGLEP